MKKGILLCVLLSGCDLARVVPRFYAKEVCSCLYVEKRDEKSCHQFGKQIVPNWNTSIDSDQKKVIAWGLFYRSEAQFLSAREGCQITR